MYTSVVKTNAWKWLCGVGCFFIPELLPGGRCVPEGIRCQCEATSLSLWCPFSPLPTVTCYLRSPKTRVYFFRTRLQLSLFTGGLLCVFKCFQLQFIGNSIYYMATLKILIIQGNMSKVGVFHLPQDTWEAGSDPQQTWGEERAEQIFTQPS